VTDDDRSARSSDVSHLARGGGLNLIGALVAALGSTLLYVILTRGLDQSTAGAFIESIAIFSILSITGTLGADTGLVWAVSRSLAKDRSRDLRRFVLVAVAPVAVVGLAFAALIWFNADSIARTFGGEGHEQTITDIVRVMAPIVPIGSVFLATLGATRGFNTMVPTVVLNRLARSIIQPVAAAVILAAGGTITALTVGWTVPYALGLVVALVWLVRLLRAHRVADSTPPRPVRLLALRFWRFTLPRSFAAIFRVGVQWIDVLLVGAVMTPADAATYAVASRLLQFGLFVAASVGQVAQPMFAGLIAAGHRDRAKHVFQTATGWQVAVVWPQYLVASFFAALLLRIVFGGAYVDGAAVVAILAVSTMVGSAAGPVDMLLLMAGKSTWSLWNTGATLAVNIALNLVLIPEYGIVGAAVSWSISRLVANALPLAEVAVHLRLHPFGRATLLAAAGATATYGVLGAMTWLIDDQHVGWFVAYLVAATGAYAVFLRKYRDELELPLAWKAFRRRGGRRAQAADAVA
jgi:O-antigen/teichoic acid export membrane protein